MILFLLRMENAALACNHIALRVEKEMGIEQGSFNGYRAGLDLGFGNVLSPIISNYLSTTLAPKLRFAQGRLGQFCLP